jgi:hypothetical protein
VMRLMARPPEGDNSGLDPSVPQRASGISPGTAMASAAGRRAHAGEH